MRRTNIIGAMCRRDIEGPLVARIQAAFQEHWVKTFGEALSGADQFPPLSPAGDLKAQVVLSRSFSMAPIPLLEAVAFAAAERRIWITNSYCTPTDDQVDALVKAVQRHVDVRLLLPENTMINRSRNQPDAPRTDACWQVG